MDVPGLDFAGLISDSVNRALKEQGKPSVEITRATRLVGGEDLEIDSLDLAVIVADLQEATGKDPFAESFVPFTTVGELIDLFSSGVPSDTSEVP